MASKVLVPAPPFAKLQVKKSPPGTGTGFIIAGSDAAGRVAHLEQSVRFLQEQHRLMLSGLHAEIEALRERNRDLQFQLIFNKESSSKINTPPAEDAVAENNEEANLKREVSRLEREAAAARGEARAAEARALQLQKLVDEQTEKLRTLQLTPCSCASDETRAELRARLTDAERLVRRLRGDAERQRREVTAASGVTNLLFDGTAARHAHLQCMKNSLHASLRASGLDSCGYQNNYHFPPLHTPEFWREPLRDEYSMGNLGSMGRGRARRPLTLPVLAASGQQIPRATIYANHHTRNRAYEPKKQNGAAPNGEAVHKSPEEIPTRTRLKPIDINLLGNFTEKQQVDSKTMYPELKIVVTKMLPFDEVSTGNTEAGRPRRRRPHRKHAPDHT